MSDLISKQINLFDIKTLTHALNRKIDSYYYYYYVFIKVKKKVREGVLVEKWSFLTTTMTMTTTITKTIIRMAFNTNVQFNENVPHSSL